MKNKLFVLTLAIFLVFSIAHAGQITYTNTSIYFFEDNQEVKIANGVIGLQAYKNKGLENTKVSYYESKEFQDSKAYEDIEVQEYKNGMWKKVNFAHYSVEISEETNTLTKKYWNIFGENFEVNYKLNGYTSPAKLTMKLWSFMGTYRVIWKVAEINMDKEIEIEHKKYYGDEDVNKNNFELMINYKDFIDSIGVDKVSITTEMSPNGKINSTVFTLGSFSIDFLDVLILDPQITTGSLVGGKIVDMYKDGGNRYWVLISGDPDGGTADQSYIMNGTNITGTVWNVSAKSTDSNGAYIMIDNNSNMHMMIANGYIMNERNTTNGGVSWSTQRQAFATYGAIAPYSSLPRSFLMPNNNVISWGMADVSDVCRFNMFNPTTSAWTTTSSGSTANCETSSSIHFEDSNNYTYLVSRNGNTYKADLRYSTNFGTSSNTIANISNLVDGILLSIKEFNNKFHVFMSASTDNYLVYTLYCNKSTNCDAIGEWSNTTVLQDSFLNKVYGNAVLSTNEGIFLYETLTEDSGEWGIYTLRNDSIEDWFYFNDGIHRYNNTSAVSDQREAFEDSQNIVLMFTDDVAGVWEVFSEVKEKPDVVVRFADAQSDSTIFNNLTVNVSCGATFIKQANITTGSLAMYPSDYSGCSTNATTISLFQGTYQAEDLNLTRTTNLVGYLFDADPVGWNISLNAGGCTNTSVPTAIGNSSYCFNLFANNGTANTTKYCQVFNPNLIYNTIDIDLYGTINMTIYPNTTTPTTYINKTFITSRPTSSLTQINEDVWITDRFRARDRRGSAQLTTFFMFANNSTSNVTLNDAGTGWINTSLEYLPLGTTTLHFAKDMFNDSYNTTVLNCSYLLLNQSMEKAGLQVQTFNEDTLASMTFNITIANSTNTTTFLNQVNGIFWNYTQIPNGAITIKVSADGFEQREYLGTMNSITFINQTAYLLSNSDGLIRSFVVVNSNYQAISGAYISIEKLIGSTYVLISDGYTDDSGIKTCLMNPSDTYRVEATYGTATSGYEYIQPTQPSYTIQIPLTTTAIGGYSGIFTQVSYTIYPNTLWVQASNSSNFVFSVTAWVNDLGSFSMVLKDQNNTVLYNNTTISTAGGTINASIDTTNISQVRGFFTINRTGFTPFTITKYYSIDDFQASNSSLLSVFTSMQGADDISVGAKSLIILVVTVAVMGTVIGFVGGFGAGAIGITIITISTFFQWFDYRITILIWSLLIGIILLLRGI